MRNEVLQIDGIGSAGYATPSSDPVERREILRAWSLMWLSKLALVTHRCGVADPSFKSRLQGLLTSLLQLDPGTLHSKLMRYQPLTLIHRIERRSAANDWSDTTSAMLDKVVAEIGSGAPDCARSAPDILDITDYPEFAKFRTEAERPSELSVREIEEELSHASARIAEIWPEAMDDYLAYVQAVLPMSMPRGRFNSASSDEVPFVVQITIYQSAWPMLLAESLIHEMSHIKLDIAASMQPLLTSLSTEKIYNHPWRPDKRPLIGVLLGAHAFLNVMLFYRRATELGFDTDRSREQYLQRRQEVGVAIALLDTNLDKFTPFGLEILRDIQSAYVSNLDL